MVCPRDDALAVTAAIGSYYELRAENAEAHVQPEIRPSSFPSYSVLILTLLAASVAAPGPRPFVTTLYALASRCLPFLCCNRLCKPFPKHAFAAAYSPTRTHSRITKGRARNQKSGYRVPLPSPRRSGLPERSLVAIRLRSPPLRRVSLSHLPPYRFALLLLLRK